MLFALIAVSQAGCSSNYLAPSSETNVDLRGYWEIERVSSDDVRKLMEKESDNADRGTNLRKEIQRLLRGSGIALVRQEFGVLSADSMSIEADQFSFGFDYEPGTYRDVSLGRRKEEYGRYILVGTPTYSQLNQPRQTFGWWSGI